MSIRPYILSIENTSPIHKQQCSQVYLTCATNTFELKRNSFVFLVLHRKCKYYLHTSKFFGCNRAAVSVNPLLFCVLCVAKYLWYGL